ncbi:ATP-binding protein [Saccharopolyspora halophila]|uniref:Sensor-like histidine kinase SenX3 n=1 Tax=Saccharopolyspora halophila TaxID=405551 RepID=A0ABP5SEJ7_9PSEU
MTALGCTALIIAALLLGAVAGFLLPRAAGRAVNKRPKGPTVAELLQRQMHTSANGVALLNRFGDVVLHNPRADELGVVRQHRADSRAIKAAEQALSTGEPVETDLSPTDGRVTLRGRGPAAVHGEVRPLGDGFVVIDAVDQSESVRLEATRRDFVANVSHELKTPVGALALLAEAVMDTADDADEVRRFADKILHESTRLGTLVSELIALSRLQGAERLPELTTVEVDDVVDEALGRAKLAAESAGIEITVDEPSGQLLDGDRALLVTALSNLITNAIAYSPHSSPVSISRRLNGDYVEIAVTDRGIGIAPEHHERVFERFFRVDPARSRATGGTGLGLAIVKHVAANHGGEVKLWSRPGTGSTFTMRVPRRSADEDEEVVAESDVTAEPAAASTTESADGVTTVETGGVR